MRHNDMIAKARASVRRRKGTRVFRRAWAKATGRRSRINKHRMTVLQKFCRDYANRANEEVTFQQFRRAISGAVTASHANLAIRRNMHGCMLRGVKVYPRPRIARRRRNRTTVKRIFST